ncbi:hypothetical protein DPM19_20230 [Actinomadura craniellae]|uniref:Uncharacterized protein n=1 Tax=Actinomadura craniellae TaxID=2231787 RepID=A0A365H2X5_9ACTN|nr:hypothetical protein DPM19_20230 [Actinomadura craniellae]
MFGLGIAGGEKCQTVTPADITLKSGAGFDPLGGGTLSGKYALPGLKGCGFLGGLVSLLTSGPGNTLSVKLTPKD